MEIQDLVKQSLNRNVNDNGSLRMENATGKTIRKEFKKYCTVKEHNAFIKEKDSKQSILKF